MKDEAVSIPYPDIVKACFMAVRKRANMALLVLGERPGAARSGAGERLTYQNVITAV